MSMAALRSNLAMMARAAAAEFAPPRLCIVSTAHTTEYAVKVFIEPEHIETNYLPVVTPFVGNGWGLFCKPATGDQVLVIFIEGDINSGIVVGGLFSDVDRPLPAPERELWLVHKGGSFFKLTNDTKVLINAVSDLNLTVGGKVNLTVQGDANVTVSGALNATVTGKATISASEFDLAGNVKLTGSLDATAGLKVGGVTLTVP
jgi:phage baseplate assembly protein V